MSQNGTADTRLGRIVSGKCSGYQRVRDRCPGNTSRSNTPRVRASDTQVEPSGTTSVSNSGTALGVTGSEKPRS